MGEEVQVRLFAAAPKIFGDDHPTPLFLSGAGSRFLRDAFGARAE